MSLADDLVGIANEPVGRMRCSIGLILDALDDRDRTALETALDDPAVRPTSLARVLRSHGYQMSEHTIRRHRRRDCRCPCGSG